MESNVSFMKAGISDCLPSYIRSIHNPILLGPIKSVSIRWMNERGHKTGRATLLPAHTHSSHRWADGLAVRDILVSPQDDLWAMGIGGIYLSTGSDYLRWEEKRSTSPPKIYTHMLFILSESMEQDGGGGWAREAERQVILFFFYRVWMLGWFVTIHECAKCSRPTWNEQTGQRAGRFTPNLYTRLCCDTPHPNLVKPPSLTVSSRSLARALLSTEWWKPCILYSSLASSYPH